MQAGVGSQNAKEIEIGRAAVLRPVTKRMEYALKQKLVQYHFFGNVVRRVCLSILEGRGEIFRLLVAQDRDP
jgi:hypothetical protein